MGYRFKRSIANMSAEEYLKVLNDLCEELFHDFKNSLATISGLSQITSSLTASEEIKGNMGIIKEASLEARDQIDKFYGFIKGSDVKECKYEILSNIVLKCLDLTNYRIDKLNNDIELSVNVHSMKKVYCNEYKMRQAILNILINAIDAMEETGGVLEVNLYEERDSENIVLEIIDTGIGIDKDNLERIFKAGYTTKGNRGTGLGLKVSENTFEDCGGTIEVNSKLGKGTKFMIYLPAKNSWKIIVSWYNIFRLSK